MCLKIVVSCLSVAAVGDCLIGKELPLLKKRFTVLTVLTVLTVIYRHNMGNVGYVGYFSYEVILSFADAHVLNCYTDRVIRIENTQFPKVENHTRADIFFVLRLENIC